jgi:hypothetical protein
MCIFETLYRITYKKRIIVLAFHSWLFCVITAGRLCRRMIDGTESCLHVALILHGRTRNMEASVGPFTSFVVCAVLKLRGEEETAAIVGHTFTLVLCHKTNNFGNPHCMERGSEEKCRHHIDLNTVTDWLNLTIFNTVTDWLNLTIFYFFNTVTDYYFFIFWIQWLIDWILLFFLFFGLQWLIDWILLFFYFFEYSDWLIESYYFLFFWIQWLINWILLFFIFLNTVTDWLNLTIFYFLIQWLINWILLFFYFFEYSDWLIESYYFLFFEYSDWFIESYYFLFFNTVTD